ncbi:18119_t:CDS:2, partial [Cetraspora pellucida]
GIRENEVASENVVTENVAPKNVVPQKHNITKSYNQKENSQISLVNAFKDLDVFPEDNALNELL